MAYIYLSAIWMKERINHEIQFPISVGGQGFLSHYNLNLGGKTCMNPPFKKVRVCAYYVTTALQRALRYWSLNFCPIMISVNANIPIMKTKIRAELKDNFSNIFFTPPWSISSLIEYLIYSFMHVIGRFSRKL